MYIYIYYIYIYVYILFIYIYNLYIYIYIYIHIIVCLVISVYRFGGLPGSSICTSRFVISTTGTADTCRDQKGRLAAEQ